MSRLISSDRSRHTRPPGPRVAHPGEPGSKMGAILWRVQRAYFLRKRRTGSGATSITVHSRRCSRGHAASVTRRTGQGHGGPAVLRRPNVRASCPGSTHNQRFCTVARRGRVAWERLTKTKIHIFFFTFFIQLFI